MKLQNIVFFLLLISSYFLLKTEARIFRGKDMSTGSNWNYLARFCYLPSDKNYLYYEFELDGQDTKLEFYYDQYNTTENGSWFAVYQNDHLTCQEKVSYARGENNLKTTPKGETNIGQKFYHFWWIVVADCNVSSIKIKDWSLTFLNPGNQQLSCDEIGSI